MYLPQAENLTRFIRGKSSTFLAFPGQQGRERLPCLSSHLGTTPFQSPSSGWPLPLPVPTASTYSTVLVSLRPSCSGLSLISTVRNTCWGLPPRRTHTIGRMHVGQLRTSPGHRVHPACWQDGRVFSVHLSICPVLVQNPGILLSQESGRLMSGPHIASSGANVIHLGPTDQGEY